MTAVPTICFLTGTLNAFAGAERMAAIVASALAARGYRVHVLSLWDRSSCFALHPAVHHEAVFEHRPSFKRMYPATVRRIREFVKRNRVDVLIEVDTMLTLFTLPATLGLTVRRIAWEHCHFNEDLGKPLRKVARHVSALTSAAVVVLTARDRECWKQTLASPGRVRLIANPLPFALPKLAHDADARVLLAVGRLTSAKGFDVLLRAWAIASAALPDWRLRIVGEGEERSNLERLRDSLGLAGSVALPGATADIQAEYLQAGAFCLSSRYEGFGLALVEAMACGLPVVSTECETGPKELLRNGANALVVPVGNHDALAAAVVAICSDVALRTHLVGEGRKLAEQFDENGIIGQWESLLHEVGRAAR